jgi:hypothetical protein
VDRREASTVEEPRKDKAGTANRGALETPCALLVGYSSRCGLAAPLDGDGVRPILPLLFTVRNERRGLLAAVPHQEESFGRQRLRR